MRVGDLSVGILAFFVGQRNLYVALCDTGTGRTSTFRVGACSDLIPRIELLSPALAGTSSEAQTEDIFHRFSTEWGRHLLPPAGSLACFDVLVLLPHSVMHGVPLHAVCVEQQCAPLGLMRGVVYVPSGTDASRCASRNPARKRGVSSWEFSLSKPNPRLAPRKPSRCFAVASDVIHGDNQRYERLATSIAACFDNGVVWPGRGRDGLNVSLIAQSFDSLCVVCHGYDAATPAKSGLLLGPSGGYGHRKILLPGFGWCGFADLPFGSFPATVTTHNDEQGEIVTVEELRLLFETHAELVALIGCSTAAGSLIRGGEYVSLASQWLGIGAVSVLGGAWAVDVRVAESVVPTFFERWLEWRQPKAIALREALREEVTKRALPISHWAVFTLLGDWV